jgi:hypothetical protein
MKSQFTITEALIERTGSTDPRRIVVRYDWLEDAERQFRAIEKLPDGWDGNGAPRPDARSLEAAWGLLTSLCRVEGLSKPHVNPTPCGGVQFEWENGFRYFEIEVVAERAATYLYRDDALSIEETGEIFEDEPLNGVLDYIRRVEIVSDRTSTRTSASNSLGARKAVA